MNEELKEVLRMLPDGKRNGGDPEDEREHFYLCAACGQAVDKRRLEQVFHHIELGHKPIELN